MLFFKSEFKKDLIVLLLVTILLSSLLASGIGFISDYYFGDAVNSLIGDYEDNDLLLIIDQKREKQAIKEIKKIVKEKLPGSKVISGISLAGKSNAFIALDNKYKTRKVFLELEDYFAEIKGITTTSIMTEPRLTINGLKNKSSKVLEKKIAKLKNVDFTFPDGDNLEVIVTEAQFTSQVKEKINRILADFQVLGIRFAIDSELDNYFKLGEEIEAVINSNFAVTADNITESNSSDLDSLVQTMNEMKKFLASYATEVKINLFKGEEVKVGDRLVIPAKNKGEIYLRVSNVNDMIATAVIIVGDSSEILDNLVYKSDATNPKYVIGEVQINNPRQELSYLVTELNKLVAQLNHIFTDANSLISGLEEVFSTLELLNYNVIQIESLNNKLLDYSENIKQINLTTLKKDLSFLEQRLNEVVFIIKKLEVVRNAILDLERRLVALKAEVAVVKEDFAAKSNYYKQLTKLEANINALSTKLRTNTGAIINYINQYNPLLIEIKSWQSKVKAFNKVIDKLIIDPKAELGSDLKRIIKPDLVTKIKKVREPNLEQKLQSIKRKLQALKKIDFEGITKEIEYIQQSLPKLKDEEITSSIDLLDHYLAGKVIPGGEISILLPAVDLDLKDIKSQVRKIVQQQINFYTSPPGIIVPNLRSQIYQILSEVKIVLTAVTAIICTVLSLLFDQGLIITSLQELNSGVKWYRNSAFYYSLAAGGITLSSIIYLTGFSSPYFPCWGFWLIGSGLGLLIFKEAKVITGISQNEFKAGEALGFNYGQIMRQIIIPAGKPGILKFLNQRKTYF